MNNPFPVSKLFVEKSPFLNTKDVQQSLKKYQKGESIGFSKIASLKSMGLLPRTNGKYILGQKYTKLDRKKFAQ